MRYSTRLFTQNLLHDVRRAADLKPHIRQLPIKQRNSFLGALVAQVEADRDDILVQNRRDCEQFVKLRNTGGSRPNFALTPIWIDRLLEGVERLAELPDPLGLVRTLPDAHEAIVIEETRVPIGMVGVMSRLRPRIMLDAVAMAIKSGNVVLVDNGGSVTHTSRAIMESVHRALTAVDIPHSAVVHIDDTPEERNSATSQWLRMNEFVDVGIVCGSNRLYEFAAAHTAIPLIRATGHVCTLYIDKDADFATALRVVKNAKFQRVNATNAINNLLIHCAFERTADLLDHLSQLGVTMVGDETVSKLFPAAGLATEEDWIGVQNGFSNFQKLCVRIITKGLDEAVGFLSTYGSAQSDGIISTNQKTIDAFLQRVDSAVVYANASTRFSSGDCFGFGTDLAIATSRLHCRGPVSAQSLTTTKYVVRAVDMSQGAVR